MTNTDVQRRTQRDSNYRANPARARVRDVKFFYYFLFGHHEKTIMYFFFEVIHPHYDMRS